jgi:hypothetical protein
LLQLARCFTCSVHIVPVDYTNGIRAWWTNKPAGTLVRLDAFETAGHVSTDELSKLSACHFGWPYGRTYDAFENVHKIPWAKPKELSPMWSKWRQALEKTAKEAGEGSARVTRVVLTGNAPLSVFAYAGFLFQRRDVTVINAKTNQVFTLPPFTRFSAVESPPPSDVFIPHIASFPSSVSSHSPVTVLYITCQPHQRLSEVDIHTIQRTLTQHKLHCSQLIQLAPDSPLALQNSHLPPLQRTVKDQFKKMSLDHHLHGVAFVCAGPDALAAMVGHTLSVVDFQSLHFLERTIDHNYQIAFSFTALDS